MYFVVSIIRYLVVEIKWNNFILPIEEEYDSNEHLISFTVNECRIEHIKWNQGNDC